MTLKAQHEAQPGRYVGQQYITQGGTYRVQVDADFRGGHVTLMARTVGPDGRAEAYRAVHTWRSPGKHVCTLGEGDVYFDVVGEDAGPPVNVRPAVKYLDPHDIKHGFAA